MTRVFALVRLAVDIVCRRWKGHLPLSKDPVSALRKKIRRYDLESVIAAAGALQVESNNVEYSSQLETLAHAAATTVRGSAKTPSPEQLKQLVEDPLLEQLANRDDHPVAAFVETVTFHGGGYRVFGGSPAAEDVFTLRTFLELFTRERLVRDYSRFAVGLLTCALSVSDRVAERAGCSPTMRVEGREGDREGIFVPDLRRLAQLTRAVAFSSKELQEYLAGRSCSLSELEPLIVGIGNVPKVLEGGPNPLWATPIVRSKGHLVVAIPSALQRAAVHHALVAADRRGLATRVGACLLEMSWRTVTEIVQRMRWAPTVLTPLTSLSLPNSKEQVFAFDVDKLAYVLLIADPLESYEKSPLRQTFDNEALTQRLSEIEEWIAALDPTPCELQMLVVVSGVGRACLIGPDPSKLRFASVMTVATADLETMSLLEPDALGLWKFQHASKLLRQETTVGPSFEGPLNEFWYYLEREHSYYFSEEAPPHFLMFDGGAAGLAREKTALNEDRHAVVGPSPETIVEVTRTDQRGPIYARRERNALREFCVCSSSIPIWVVSALERDGSGQRQGDGPAEDNGSIHLACRAMAFWAAESLGQAQNSVDACRHHHRLLLRIHIVDLGAWDTRQRERPAERLVASKVDRLHGSIELVLSDAFAYDVADPDNRAERALLLEYLVALEELASLDGAARRDAEALAAIVDAVAPVGHKKQISLTATFDDPQLDPQGLPPARFVQRHDEQLLMDTLGRTVIDTMRLPTGPLEPDVARRVLHSVVADLYARLQQRVASLCPIGLLESLIVANEALVQHEAEKKVWLAPRVACAKSSQEALEDIMKDSNASATSAIAMRCLIEYVAARPPNGFRKLSASVMDELLAITSMMTFMGTASDVAEFGIGRVEIAALASRRVHVDPTEFNAAMRSYLAMTTRRDLDRARGQRQRTRVPDIRSSLKEAIASEFGVSSEKAREVIGALHDIGIERHPAIAVFDRQEIEALAAERAELPTNEVRAMLEKLTISPRLDFLKPPKPYDKHDVYPWRFGRGMSLLQRPLVLREWDGRQRLSWGPRQLWGAWQHLGYRLAHGSWRAPNQATKKILGTINDARGSVFEQEVAAHLKDRRGLLVRERVFKLDGARIQQGDIDVLVAVPGTRRLWLLECKDLARASTPWSVKNEIEALFVDTAKEKAIQTRHEARVAWARGRTRELLALVNVNEDAWDVRGAIVTGVELVAPLLATARMPVVPWHQLDTFDW